MRLTTAMNKLRSWSGPRRVVRHQDTAVPRGRYNRSSYLPVHATDSEQFEQMLRHLPAAQVPILQLDANPEFLQTNKRRVVAPAGS